MGAGPLPVERSPASDQRAAGLGVKLLLGGLLLLVGAATFLLVIAVLLKVFEWTVYPIMDAVVVPLFWSVFSRPGGAVVLALLILALGLPQARRFRRPARFRVGLIVIALALVTFWPMQALAARITVPFWEYQAVLHGLGLFISVTLLAGGLEAIRRAGNTPGDDSWEL